MVAFRGCAQSYPTFVDTDAAPSQKRGLLFETVRRYPTPSNFAKGAAHGPEFPRTACGVLTVRLYRMFPPTSFAHKLIISTLSVPQPAMRQDVGLQPNLSRNHRENALGPENPSRYARSRSPPRVPRFSPYRAMPMARRLQVAGEFLATAAGSVQPTAIALSLLTNHCGPI